MNAAFDNDLFYADFGVSVIPAGGTTITAMFEGPYAQALGGVDGLPNISTTKPILVCQASDVAGVSQGDAITVEADSGLGVPGGDYTVADILPQGLDTILELQEA